MISSDEILDVHVIRVFDPDVFKATSEDFSRGEDRSFKGILVPTLMDSGGVEAVYFCGKYAHNVSEDSNGFSFKGWPAKPVSQNVFTIDLRALTENDIVKRLEWAGQIGEVWVMYQVSIGHPVLLRLLQLWTLATTPQQPGARAKSSLGAANGRLRLLEYRGAS